METDLRQITADVAVALGNGWRFEPGAHDHFCHLVQADGLTLWVRVDPNKPGRLMVRCDTVEAIDIYGHPIHYGYNYNAGPSITAAVTRPPAGIASDIRTRLLPEARVWWAEAIAWKEDADKKFAIVEGMRRRLLSLPDSHRGHDCRQIYGPGWECETFTDSASLKLQRLTHNQALALLQAYMQLKEQDMQKPNGKPAQDHMFPTGDDLPLFSETPVKVIDRPFAPQPVAAQPSLLDLRPTFGAEEPSYGISTEEQTQP